MEKEKLDVFAEIENEIKREISEEKKENSQLFKKTVANSRNVLLGLLEKMLGKLLINLKIKITVYWKEKELFSYEIPKN